MNVIRSILLTLEKDGNPEAELGLSNDELLHHLDLLFDAGLLEGQALRGNAGQLVGASIQKITWSGYDFLAVAKNDDSWTKATSRASSVGAWTLEILKQLLISEAKTKLGL